MLNLFGVTVPFFPSCFSWRHLLQTLKMQVLPKQFWKLQMCFKQDPNPCLNSHCGCRRRMLFRSDYKWRHIPGAVPQLPVGWWRRCATVLSWCWADPVGGHTCERLVKTHPSGRNPSRPRALILMTVERCVFLMCSRVWTMKWRMEAKNADHVCVTGSPRCTVEKIIMYWGT